MTNAILSKRQTQHIKELELKQEEDKKAVLKKEAEDKEREESKSSGDKIKIKVIQGHKRDTADINTLHTQNERIAISGRIIDFLLKQTPNSSLNMA